MLAQTALAADLATARQAERLAARDRRANRPAPATVALALLLAAVVVAALLLGVDGVAAGYTRP